MKYVCIRDGCWNQTAEVLCPKHRREAEARDRANAALQAVADARRTEEGE